MSQWHYTVVCRTCLVLISCLMAGCGDSEKAGPPPASEAPDHWTAPTERNGSDEGPHAAKQFVSIALPEARNGSRDEWDFQNARPLVLNLLSDGEVYVKGAVFHLGDSDPEERQGAIQALPKMLEVFSLRALQGTTAGGPPLRWLVLHFDRSCSWRDAADCIRAALTAGVPADTLQIAIRSPVPEEDHVLNLALRSAAPEAAPGLRIRIGRAKDKPTRVQVGDLSVSFPGGDNFDDPEFIARANRVWTRIERGIRMPAGTTAASITVEGEVRWAYIVKLLDILLEGPGTTFRFPADGFTISAGSEPAQVDRRDHDAPTADHDEWPKELPATVIAAVGKGRSIARAWEGYVVAWEANRLRLSVTDADVREQYEEWDDRLRALGRYRLADLVSSDAKCTTSEFLEEIRHVLLKERVAAHPEHRGSATPLPAREAEGLRIIDLAIARLLEQHPLPPAWNEELGE